MVKVLYKAHLEENDGYATVNPENDSEESKESRESRESREFRESRESRESRETPDNPPFGVPEPAGLPDWYDNYDEDHDDDF